MSNTTTELTITLRTLRKWQACDDGRQWFESKFPQGAAYCAVQQALRDEGRLSYSTWLNARLFDSLLNDPLGVTTAAVNDANTEVAALVEQTNPQKVQANTPPDAGAASKSGYAARIGSSGHYAKIGSSGYAVRIGSSGDYAYIGSSGDAAQIGSSGDSARIGSSGDSARINATTRNAAIACLGWKSIARAGEGGFIALAWRDEKADRPRIAVGYVGENIEADTWYGVNADGELIEVDASESDDE